MNSLLKARRAHAASNRNRCPNCGKFIQDDPDGFFAPLIPGDDMNPIVPFCDSECLDAFYLKKGYSMEDIVDAFNELDGGAA